MSETERVRGKRKCGAARGVVSPSHSLSSLWQKIFIPHGTSTSMKSKLPQLTFPRFPEVFINPPDTMGGLTAGRAVR